MAKEGDLDISKKSKISFNLSPSSLNMFMQSPLLFYLTYIAKVPDDTPVPVCYSLSGRIIHSCLERYAKKELDRDSIFSFFLEEWSRYNLDEHLNLKDETLSKEDYLAALIRGLEIVDAHENHVPEQIISFPFIENENIKIGVKGIVDLQANKKGDNSMVVVDYKTSNSISQNEDFERQALFYNYLIHKKSNIIPEKTVFHYLKLGVPKTYSFTHDDIRAFEEELKIIANQILEYGTDIGKYPQGNINDIFNSKKQACVREINRRNGFSTKEYLTSSYKIQEGIDMEIFSAE